MRHAARPTHSNPAVIRVGRTWLFSDGTRLPVVGGAADGDGAPVVPDDLTTVDRDELTSLEDQLVAEFDRLHDAGSTDVAAFEAIAEALDRVRTEASARDDADAQAAAQIAALRNRVHAAPEDDGNDDDGGDDPGEGDPADGDGGAGAEDTTADREPVVAAAPPARPVARPSAAAAARRAPRPRVTETAPRVSITAAADLAGFTTGQSINTTDVAMAMHDKARALSNGSPRVPIARFTIPFAAEQRITPGMSREAALTVLDTVSAPTNLVAAGGWCTPSQNMYDLLELDGATGLLDLPSAGIERGGVNVPSYIGIDSADGALWDWTEAQDALTALTITDLDVASNVATVTTSVPHLLEVGDLVSINVNTLADGPRIVTAVGSTTTFTFAAPEAPNATNATGTATRQKSVFRIPCPTWTDTRLAAYGITIEHGNLSDRAFPELTRRYISLALNAHLHRMSTIHLAKMSTSAHSVAVTVTAGGSDTYGDVMSAIELQAVDFRSEHKISDRVVIEVILPVWVKGSIRTTLAMRAGVDMLSITDAQIMAALAVRNIRPQFVEDYQPLWNGTPRAAWPTALTFLMYPAGSFVEGNGGTIDLGVVRDSRLNATNDFTAAWTEDFRLLVRKGPKARKVAVTISTDGVTACCP
jgi:hypothetical protein